jgi:hypothetical protein
MLHDNLLDFLPVGSNLSCVGAPGASFPSNVYDILGVGVGLPPPNIIGVQNATFGSDTGNGLLRPRVLINVGTAFATADAATLTVQFQGAPDTGAAGGYQPGAYQTFEQSPVLTAAQLTAGQEIVMDWPAAFPANEQPRFLRLLFTTPAGEQFTAGTISSAITTLGPDEATNRFAQRNFNA